MKYLLLLLIVPHLCVSQRITTEVVSENRITLSSNISLPTAKFHLVKNTNGNQTKGYLELFSSFGIGLSLNYGKANFFKNVENQKIIEDQTEFSNIIGLQMGLLYSSKINAENQTNINLFSIYGGINILDLQLGLGYELGTKHFNSNGYFVSVAYGIPMYKLTGKGSYIFPKRIQKKKIGNQKYAFHRG